MDGKLVDDGIGEFLEIGVLVIAIAVLTRLAARIFRMGMLTYGKRVSFREVWGFLKEK